MVERMVKPKQPEFAVSSEGLLKKVVAQNQISHFYAFETRDDLQDIMVVPDGSVDIVFCCDSNPYAYIAGTPLHHAALQVRTHTRYFGVRFLPGVVPQLGDYSVNDLIEGQISLDDLPQAHTLATRIFETRDFFRQASIFSEDWMKRRARQQQVQGDTQLASFLIHSIVGAHGEVRVQELAQSCHYSARHLHQVMRAQTGMSPKTFSRIVRFQSLLSALTEQLDSRGIDLAQLAAQLGYYDQSHMVREFKDYTGMTPMKYLCHLRRDEYRKKLIVVK